MIVGYMIEKKIIKHKKKIVAHVLKSSIYSGAENVALTIIKGLQDEFEFVYIATEGPIREKLNQEQIPCFLLEKFDRKHVKKALESIKPDIIHAHDFSATVMCVLSSHCPIISHLHYDPPWARVWNLKTLIYAVLGKKVSTILAVSQRAYENLVFSDILKDKMQMVGNPIDKNYILSLGEDRKQERYDLLFVGRFVEQKAPELFIEIVKRVRDMGKNLHCAMVGAGELEEQCRMKIRENNLQDYIELLGFQKNPYQFMKSSKILCVTSRWEGYGLVAAEANILGIPVLSTMTGGVTEIFGENAVELCRDADDFVKKILLLLNEPKEYQRWQKRADERAKDFITPDVYIRKLEEIYKKEMECR